MSLILLRDRVIAVIQMLRTLLFLNVNYKIDWSMLEMKYQKDNPSYGYQVSDSLLADIVSNRVNGTSLRLDNSGYTGEYSNEFYGNLIINEKNGKLFISRGNKLQGILNHWHYDTFQVRWDSPRERARFQNEFITFHFNARNEPYVLERIMDGKPAYFIRIAMLSETS